MQTMMTTMMRHACVRGLQFSKLGCALAGQMVIDVRADVVPNTGVIRGCDARLGKAQSWPTFVCMTSVCVIIDLSAVPVPVPRVDWGLGTILFQDLVSISCSHPQNVLYTALVSPFSF